MTHFMYIPFTGLGLYGGFRGNRWLRNRIKVFKHYVVPSLQAQTEQNFKLWVSWRPEERTNKHTKELYEYLVDTFGEERVIFTYNGLCFWDDKYDDEQAHNRLIMSLHHTLGKLIDHVGDVKEVLMTIQPSDDCYNKHFVESTQQLFAANETTGVLTSKQGYLMNYQTGEMKEYNPKTNPPFFTIRFSKEDFIDPLRHAKHTGPYKSHEYVVDYLKETVLEGRNFLVGTHGENVSTHFNHPYGGENVEIPEAFDWLKDIKPLKIRYSVRKQIMRKLPHGWQRKLRYIFGEKVYARIYHFLRN